MGGIADFLFQRGVPSPTEKAIRSRSVIDHLPSNGLYAYGIVSFDAFYAARRRSNLDPDRGPQARKATQYNSKNVLSGPLVRGECGRSYRRITRPSGEIVWRYANRAESGKRIDCHASSIPETELTDTIRKMLGLDAFEPETVKGRLESIRISLDGSLLPSIQKTP